MMKKSELSKKLIPAVSGIVTGLLQVWLYIPWLAFISIAPMLINVYRFTNKKDYYKTVIAFLLPYYFVQCLFLITIPDVMPLPKILGYPLAALAVAALTAWLSAIMFLPLWFYPRIMHGKICNLLVFSLLFIVGEWLAEYVPVLSFPWSGVWLSVISEPKLFQTAALLGSHFVSLIILLTNSAAAVAICHWNKRSIIQCTAVFIGILSLNYSYGDYHIKKLKSNEANIKSIKIMAAQDNVEGTAKNEVMSTQAVDSYLSIINANWQDGTDFVLLPETAVPVNYNKQSDAFSKLTQFAKEKNTELVTGCFVMRNGKTYNAMYSVCENGFCECPYLKQILVPFGESIPLASLWGANTITCAEYSDNKKLLSVNGQKIATAICIESIYPSVIRPQVLKGAKAVCISTNDSWFGKSYAKYAHYRHSIMRAAETGRYTLRAGNCGVSSVISPWGQELTAVKTSDKTAIVADIKMISSKNPYTYTGDIIILPGVLIIICEIYKTLKSRFIKTEA